MKKSWEFVVVDEWTTLSFRGLGPEESLFGGWVFDPTVNQSGDPFVPHWQQRSVKFAATDPMTTVQFLSLAPDTTGPSSNYGPTLDDVVVRKVNNLVFNGSLKLPTTQVWQVFLVRPQSHPVMPRRSTSCNRVQQP
ncbi:hypothetical protein SH139x_004052 [Planctomycetaceae bacterium SH139]